MDTDGAEGEKKTRKVKKQVRKGDLPISAGTTGLEATTKNAWAEKENAMVMEDKLVADTDEKKNELESYIYELRDKIETTYAEFSSEEEKEKLRAKLTEAEVSTAFFFLLWFWDHRTDRLSRIGSTKKAKTPPRQSTSQRWRISDSLPAPSFSDTWTRSRTSDKPSSSYRRKKPPRNALKKKLRRLLVVAPRVKRPIPPTLR